MTEPTKTLDLSTAVVLVTGANRGIGKAIARELSARGAKVYAGARNPDAITDPDVTPLRLDVTDPGSIEAAASVASDVNVVINNAGISAHAAPFAEDAIEGLRNELEVNTIAPLNVARSFAPILAGNGGGTLVNILSVLSFISLPGTAGYNASKAAAWSLTNSLRVVLRGQGTTVLGVHFGYVDTDLTTHVTAPKLDPADVARDVADAIAAGSEELLADELSKQVKSALHDDLNLLYPGVQSQYDEAVAAAA
jgi:NAD(P)-dependent dehydrogenase (short-subunit alcohol dehydrogenase family)